MSESDKSWKPELTAVDKERIDAFAMAYSSLGNNYKGEMLYDTKAYAGYSEGAKDATLHERSAAQARIAELEAQHQWMDCKHKMPEKGVEVLVWSDRYGRTFATHVDSNKHGDIWQFDGEPMLTFNSPTHWMPLPKKPQP